MVEVTERDLKVLKMLAQFGCVDKKTIYRIYEDSETKKGSAYKYKRLRKLKNEHYIVLEENYFMLGFNGKKYLESNGYKINYKTIKPEQKLYLIKISNTLSKLSKYMNVESRGDIYQLEEYQTNSEYVRRYYGRAKIKKKGRYDYVYIYRLSKGMLVAQLKKIKQEISNITTAAIILADTDVELRKYRKIKTLSNAKTEILIPYEEKALEMLQFYANGVLDDEELGKSIDDVTVLNKKMYIEDEGKRKLLVNLTTNDLVKERFLKSYSKVSDDISIICFDWQLDLYRDMFPNMQILTIDSND